MSQHSKDEYSEKQFLAHAFRRLSVTLQKANANIQSRGMHIMQMGDYAGLLGARSPFGAHAHSTRYSSPSTIRYRHPNVTSPLSKMRSMRVATAAGGVGPRRRLFVDFSHPAGVALNAGANDGDDHVTFDHIATLCHTDIMTLGEGHGHRRDDEADCGNMRPTGMVPTAAA